MIEVYRGWRIDAEFIGYSATGPDYDASYEGPEDGWVSNGQSAWGRTIREVKDAVDEWHDEQEIE